MQKHVVAVSAALLELEQEIVATGNRRLAAKGRKLHRALKAAADEHGAALGITVEPLSGGLPKDD